MSEENIFYCCRTDNVVKLLEYINTEGIEVVINLKDFDGWSLLHIAARWNSIKCLEILLDTARGAIDVNAKNNNEETPLYIASWYGSKECLEILLQNGGYKCINAKDIDGNTPLHDSVRNNSFECLEILLNVEGLDVNSKNRFGNTPLHYTALNNFKECMKALLDYGADVTIQSNKGKTFLDCIQNRELKKEMEEYVQLLSTQDIKEPAS